MEAPFDVGFITYSDTPKGKDPDSYSPTLRRYHRMLWSKETPSGEILNLSENTPKAYLHHKSQNQEFVFSSDAITHTYINTKRMASIIECVPRQVLDAFYDSTSTIGGYTIFPANRIDGKININGARGFNRKIGDRFDLTLECIRLFYAGEPNPLNNTFQLYTDFFKLFRDFRGYVDFFLLQDLVTNDYSSVNFWIEFDEFTRSPFPISVEEYLDYKSNVLEFVENRAQRMAQYFGI